MQKSAVEGAASGQGVAVVDLPDRRGEATAWSEDIGGGGGAAHPGAPPRPRVVLGVDLGLRTGTALLGGPIGGPSRLQRYASTHIGDRAALRRYAAGVVREVEPDVVAVEGDRSMGLVWARAAERVGARHLDVSPEAWRAVLLWPRERTPSATAKAAAADRARALISWSRETGEPPLPKAPTGRLRGDAADAIMVATWAALHLGWLGVAELPFDVPR